MPPESSPKQQQPETETKISLKKGSLFNNNDFPVTVELESSEKVTISSKGSAVVEGEAKELPNGVTYRPDK